MGAGTSRSGSTAKQDDVGAFVRQQEQNAKQAAQKQAARIQYEVDKRSQYKDLPQSLRDEVKFEDAYADRGPAAQKQAARIQYEVDKRSQYKNLPQSLRDKVTLEDAYADREQGPREHRPAEQKQAAQRDVDPNSGTEREYFDLGKFASLKAEVDQQRSRNNSGIAFGPGRSNRGDIDLGRQLQNRR